MKEEIRLVGVKLLSSAFEQRQEAQRRVWAAADEVNRLREQIGRAEALFATEERWLGDSQETLRLVWQDFNPRTGHLTALDEPTAARSAVSTTTGATDTEAQTTTSNGE